MCLVSSFVLVSMFPPWACLASLGVSFSPRTPTVLSAASSSVRGLISVCMVLSSSRGSSFVRVVGKSGHVLRSGSWVVVLPCPVVWFFAPTPVHAGSVQNAVVATATIAMIHALLHVPHLVFVHPRPLPPVLCFGPCPLRCPECLPLPLCTPPPCPVPWVVSLLVHNLPPAAHPTLSTALAQSLPCPLRGRCGLRSLGPWASSCPSQKHAVPRIGDPSQCPHPKRQGLQNSCVFGSLTDAPAAIGGIQLPRAVG